MANHSRAFVTGWPVTHSRSPMVHTHWLRLHGLEGTYEKQPVEPEHFKAFLSAMKKNGFAGGNVTIPHKEEACALVSKKDDAATRLGAVNTLWFEGETLWGGNTDGFGFRANMDDKAPNWSENANTKTALVIGAGGASRAIIDQLCEAGFYSVIIANRTVARAENLAQEFGPTCSACGLDGLQASANKATIIINTTSVGMSGEDALSLDFSSVDKACIVSDIVYTPLITPFLAAAKQQSLTTVDGLGMLLHQAVPGFERWFGLRPKISKAVRAMVERDLGERSLPIMLGLTGSIGMGKSTTAQMFRDAGIPVYDSDATVHALYEGEAVPLVEAEFPNTSKNGKIDRAALSKYVVGNDEAMKRLEAIVHPLVARDEIAFREKVSKEGHPIAILDAPLLFERNNADKVDAIVVVSAPADVQRKRVLARDGMSEEKFQAILARQTPDDEKRQRADHVIDSSLGFDAARDAVNNLVHIYTPLKDEPHA